MKEEPEVEAERDSPLARRRQCEKDFCSTTEVVREIYVFYSFVVFLMDIIIGAYTFFFKMGHGTFLGSFFFNFLTG